MGNLNSGPFNLGSLYSVPIANGSRIDVWIQGTKVDNEWFFHDGSMMPTDFNAICPQTLSDVNETHLRAQGSGTFKCLDMFPTEWYSFICEYYRRFSIY